MTNQEIAELILDHMGFEEILNFNDGDADKTGECCYLQANQVEDPILLDLLLKAKAAVDDVYRFLRGGEVDAKKFYQFYKVFPGDKLGETYFNTPIFCTKEEAQEIVQSTWERFKSKIVAREVMVENHANISE